MFKKIAVSLLFLIILGPNITHATTGVAARIGNKYYDTLSAAIANASSTDTIYLVSDITLEDTLPINKIVNINLNGKVISAPSAVFLVQGGSLNVDGKGTIKETEPNYGAIKVIGSKELTTEKYSTVNVGKDVTLEGWSGLFITHDSNKSYGVHADFAGTINAVSDTEGGTGIGIYVNGNIQDQTGSPVVNILDNAKINSNGNGLYIAGYATFNIKDAYIEGDESGIGIKSGILNIDGATVVCNGKDTTPSEGYNNGIKASGTAIQIESNNGYAGKMEINISNGTFKSKNSNVFYEYIGRGDTTAVKSISISGGTFVSDANKNVFLLSNHLKETHNSFISGGKYSSDPSSYLKSGYTASDEGNYFVVSKSAVATFWESDSNDNKSFSVIILVVVGIITVGGVIYLNRERIYKVLNKMI